MFGGVLCPCCLVDYLKQKYQKKQYPVEAGRLCIKTSGREAGRYCVIIDKKDSNFVVIDGQVKRRKCNISHLIVLEQKIDVKKDASTADIIKKLKAINIEVKLKKVKKQIKKEEAKKPAKKSRKARK